MKTNVDGHPCYYQTHCCGVCLFSFQLTDSGTGSDLLRVKSAMWGQQFLTKWILMEGFCTQSQSVLVADFSDCPSVNKYFRV